ncbi:MAG: hypothetical protein E7573_08235 [Ruminococcaceae bacterium]|nr:hypothetical protein [Oscillospiraceae bacterium]MBR3595482.1 hypothetical protein [Clostridia bacterium]
MLKGINRQVLEVNQPENSYFEKVIFFVRPECFSVSESKLKNSADRLIKNASKPPEKRKLKDSLRDKTQLIKMGSAAAVGAAAAALVSAIF